MLRQLGLLALSALPAALGQVSDGFENGWDQTTWPTFAPDCNQGGVVALDSTKAHTGKNSIKVTPATGYCGHIFFGTTDIPKSGDVYVRAWLQSSTALTSEHVSFIVMPDASQPAGDSLRFGAMDEVMIYNRESDDATLPDLSPQGIATSVDLPSGAWQCLEIHIGTDGTIQTWLNSALVSGLSVGPGITNANDAGWTRSAYTPKISGVYFGWEDYSGSQNTFWYDDIAVGSTRVGCAVAGSSAAPTAAPSSATATAAPTSKSAAPAPTTLKTSTTVVAAPAPSPSCAAAKYGQCGGIGWTGCTVCAAGSTCTANGAYYSQCL